MIFPCVCVICGKLLLKNNLCIDCKKKITMYYIPQIINVYNKHYDKRIHMFWYKGYIKNLLISYKFGDEPYLRDAFLEFITNNQKIIGIIKKYDIITSVPMTKNKIALRGYNQSAIIASKIARFTELEYKKKLILKVKNNKQQALLSEKERIENVNGVYAFNDKYDVRNKRVVIFDDIMTTGSTLNECSKVLKEKGAKEILVITIAKTNDD